MIFEKSSNIGGFWVSWGEISKRSARKPKFYRRIAGSVQQKNRILIVGSSAAFDKKPTFDRRIIGSVWQKNRFVIVGSSVSFGKKTEL